MNRHPGVNDTVLPQAGASAKVTVHVTKAGTGTATKLCSTTVRRRNRRFLLSRHPLGSEHTIPSETASRGKPIQLWWQNEARIGQQGTLTYVWGDKGSRPPAPRDCRYSWADIFGAVCPARGTGAARVPPYADKQAMTPHLAEISQAVAPGAHAVVIVHGAGWHKPGGRLRLPDSISTLILPACSPELNPQENIWQFLRQNYLSNRVFSTYAAIVDASRDAWNALIQMSNAITSIASREWAKAVSL